METKIKEPWKLDTNGRYTDVVKTIMSLATGTLLLPVFLAREILGIGSEKALIKVFTCSVYFAWSFLGISILAGVFFQYLSAKWVRIAWGKDAGVFFSKKTKESTIELWMEISLWASICLFMAGLAATLFYFVTFHNV